MPVGDEGLPVGLRGARHDVGVHRRVGAVGGEVGGQERLQALGAVVGQRRAGQEEKEGEEAHGRGLRRGNGVGINAGEGSMGEGWRDRSGLAVGGRDGVGRCAEVERRAKRVNGGHRKGVRCR